MSKLSKKDFINSKLFSLVLGTNLNPKFNKKTMFLIKLVSKFNLPREKTEFSNLYINFGQSFNVKI